MFFHFIPAYRLKKSWVEGHKIRSKWKAQKRREGLASQTIIAPVEVAPDHPQDKTNAFSGPNISPNHPDKSPVPIPSTSLRDLRRVAYASFSAQEAGSSCPKRAPGHARNNRGGKRETGQPNMKLRMNVLLEKIKRDLT